MVSTNTSPPNHFVRRTSFLSVVIIAEEVGGKDAVGRYMYDINMFVNLLLSISCRCRYVDAKGRKEGKWDEHGHFLSAVSSDHL